MCGIVQDIHKLETSFHKMFEGIDKLAVVYREHRMTLKQRQHFGEKLEKERLKAEQDKANAPPKKSKKKELSLKDRIDQ